MQRAWVRTLTLLGCLLAGNTLAETSVAAQREGLADRNPFNDLSVGPPERIEGCEAELTRQGVRFTAAELPVRPGRGNLPTCGAEQAVVYKGGPERIRYNTSPLLSCGMALALARFERVLSEEAQKHFGQAVARIEQGGTYNCRKMAQHNLVSEHSYANAIDIRAVVLKNGKRISVLNHFGSTTATKLSREARFLRALSHRSYDEDVFSVVLTPFFDTLHRDHLHFDLARYRVDGTR